MNPAPSLYSFRTFIDIQENNKMNIPRVWDSIGKAYKQLEYQVKDKLDGLMVLNEKKVRGE